MDAIEGTPLGQASKVFREAEHAIEDALANFAGGFPEYNLLRIEPDTGSMGARLVIEFDFLVSLREIPRSEVLSNLLAPQIARLGIGTVEVRRQVVDEFEIPEEAEATS